MTTADRDEVPVHGLQEHDPRQAGPYRLLAVLGAGGMGQVYLAAGPDGPVAVKVVHSWMADDPEFRSRFAREVAASRRVRSPWTAAVLDADVDAALPWLATEYVHGVQLDRAVRSAGPLPMPAVHALATDLARAIAAIHAAGLVHRDVKPGNVLLTTERARLIDFGISRALDATQLTGTGVAIGTPAFMSPEQADGLPAGAPSDLFSLGSVLVFAASGVGPYGDHTPLGIMRRIRANEPDLGRLAEPVRGIVARCLRRDPDDRPTADELAAALQPQPPRRYWLPPAIAALIPPPPAGTESAPTQLAPTRSAAPPALAPPTQQAPGRRVSRRALLLLGAGALGVTGAGAGFALAGLTGREPAPLWTFEAGTGVDGLTLGDGVVYVSTATGQIHAVDQASGQPRWTYTVGGPGVTAPTVDVVDGGVVIQSDDVAMVSLDAATGEQRWRVETISFLGATAGIALGEEYVSGSDNRPQLRAFDSISGALRWSYPVPFSLHSTSNPVAFDGQRVHIAIGPALATLDAATGAVQRLLPIDPEVEEIDVVRDTLLYSRNIAGGEKVLIAHDVATGALRWRRSWTGRFFSIDREEGTVIASAGRTLDAWNAVSGKPRWTISDDLGDDNPFPWPLNTSLAVAEGVCYCGTSEDVTGPGGRRRRALRLFAYATDSGRQHWTFLLDPGVDSKFPPAAPVVAVPGTVFVLGVTAVHAIANG